MTTATPPMATKATPTSQAPIRSPNRREATTIRTMVCSEPIVVALATEVWCREAKNTPNSKANTTDTGKARRTWDHVIRRPARWSPVP